METLEIGATDGTARQAQEEERRRQMGDVVGQYGGCAVTGKDAGDSRKWKSMIHGCKP